MVEITEKMIEAAAEAYWLEVYGRHRKSQKWPEDVHGRSEELFRAGCRAALSAALRAEPREPGAVKALEWQPQPPYHVARVFGNIYAVEAWDGGATLSGVGGRRDFKTFSEAKAAAQSDYENRIRSALSPAPVGVDIEEVKRVLKPFADQAETFDSPGGAEFVPDSFEPAIVGHTIGDLRNARALLSKIEGGGNG